MKPIKLTCPFTGCEFDALECADGSLIVKDVITGEQMRVGLNEPSNRYLLDRSHFEHTKLLTSSEAAELLDVSRARISAIAKTGVIPTIEVNGHIMFREYDVENYKFTRTAGRPKEG